MLFGKFSFLQRESSLIGSRSFVKKWGIAFSIFTVALFASGIFPVSQAQANETVFPLPQLAYQTQKGLDPQNNPLDRIISIWGFSCLQTPPFAGKPCSIEPVLVRFLSTLSGNINNLEQLLLQMGAQCNRGDRELKCVYARQLENCAWLAGADTPVSVVDEFFEIRTSSYDDKGLHHSAKFTRDTKPRENKICEKD
jgi:hypothetical protein